MSTDPAAVATLRTLRAPAAIAPASTAEPRFQVRAGFFDADGFELMQRVSKAFAASTLVPKEYQGNIPNCMIALNLAQRLGADALMVMQNLYIVHGRPGWSAQFLIATFNQNGRFSAIRYEFFGTRGKEDWGCRAWAIERDSGEKIVGADVSIDLARAEGWDSKSGSKWRTMPQQMLMYRAASWMIRTHAPEIAMGLPTADELADTYDAKRDTFGTYAVTTDDLRAAQQAMEDDAPQPPAVTDARAEQEARRVPQETAAHEREPVAQFQKEPEPEGKAQQQAQAPGDGLAKVIAAAERATKIADTDTAYLALEDVAYTIDHDLQGSDREAAQAALTEARAILAGRNEQQGKAPAAKQRRMSLE